MSLDVPIISSEKSSDNFLVKISGGHRIITTGRFIVLGTHGVGVIDGHHFITSAQDLAVALNGYEGTPDKLGSSIRGALTIYIEDRQSGEVYILSDPFGSSIVFLNEHNNGVTASSSLGRLVSVLELQGRKPGKSLRYAALLASSNNGGISKSPYSGIDSIDQWSFICFSVSGVKINEYSLAREVFSKIDRSAGGIKTLQNMAIDDIINNVKAASRYEAPNHVCHLTGGMDSRTVLGAVIESGYSSKYSIHCGGDPLADDMLIARKLAHSLEKNISRDSGLHFGMLPGSPAENSRWSMHETAGLLRGPANPGLHRSNDVVLSGGFGGLLRNSFGGIDSGKGERGFSADTVLSPMLGFLGSMSISSKCILNADIINFASTEINSAVLESEELGVPNDALPEFLWFRFRSRYYVGEISRSLSEYVNRFDPLYTPWLLPLAWSYPRAERGNNYAHLDLLCEINEQLGMMPYDKKRITDSYLDDRPARQLGSLPEVMSDLEISDVRVRPLEPAGIKSPISTEHYAEARRVGLPPATVADSEFFRNEAKRLAAAIGPSELSQAFNYEELTQLLSRPPKWRPQFRAIRDVHDVLAWYSA